METRLYQVAYVPPQQTALSSDVAEGDTTISVDDASAISPADTTDYYIYVRGEFMALESTDETNDTATVIRGALGTTPRAHSAGQDVYGGVIDADGTDSRELRHIDEIPNPDIKEIGEIEQNLEYQKAKFRISNCKVTINGLPKDRLRDAGSVHRPWVFEIVDDTGTVVFSGILDGESVSFTASSRNTSFDVLSWLELLDRAGSVPARDVFEVDVYGTARTEDEENAFIDENFGDIQIKLNNKASLVGDVAQVGDVAVIETDESEIRKPIVLREVDDDDRVVIFINSKEEGEGENDVIRRVPGGGSFSTNLSAARLGRFGEELRIRLTNNQEVFDLVEAVNGDISGMSTGATKNISISEGFNVELDLQYEVVHRDRAGNVTEREDRTATTALNEIEVHATNDGYFIEFSNPFDNTINTGPRADVSVDDIENGGYRARVKRDSTQRIAEDLTSDSTVRILGQQIYGYEGFPTTIPAYYEAGEIVKNIFQIEAANTTGRSQLGVLPYVFDGSAYDSVNNFDDAIGGLPIDPRVEFPDDPLKALRQIQQRQQFLLKERFSNRTNSKGDAVPGYYPEYIYRDSFFDTAVEVSERKVKEWTENVSENDLRAVIVRPNEEYLKGRAGPDVDERIGFYFEGIKRYEKASAEDIRDRMTPPDGRNVLEIEMPIIPSEEIGFKYRGEDTVENNPKIKALAKFFYEHFTKASREVDITFGNDDPEWIGGYWYFKNQGEVIDDYVFVTQETKNVDSTSIDTTLKGRIGQEAATIGDAPPRAIIKGPKEISQANSAGDVQVILNGDDSFSLSGNILNYTWERKVIGGSFSEVQTTGNILRDTISGVDVEKNYIYRLTVTDDATGSTDSVTHEVTVAPARTTPTPQPKNQDFDVKTWQQEKDGLLEVIPDQFYSLDKVEKRSKVGGNIDKGQSFTEVSRLQVGIASIDTTNDLVVLTGDYEEHFDKPFLYAKDDDEGGTVQFDISSVTYDSAADETTITLAESIGSTRFDAVETGTFVMRVDLSNKHTSAIEIRTTGSVDQTRRTQLHTFDFDALAEVDASVYNDESGAVYADVSRDEDTDNFDLEYRINGGTWQTELTGQATDIVGYEVVQASNVSDGDTVEVRITPYNFDGEEGRVITRANFYNRSTGGGASFDALTINQAGTIDNIKDGEFRFLNTDGSDNAKIDVFGLEVDEINGTSVSEFASQSDIELLAKNIVQTEADIDALDAVTVRRSRELIAGNAIGPLGDLSADRTVTVQEEDLAGTFLAPNGSGALAVQTTGDLVGDGSGKIQIGQSVVQTREIDESIAPTWTGVHTHAADIEMKNYQVRFDDGVLQGDGNGALEVLKADESNQGTLRVDEIVAHTVTVVDEIDQRNVNDLRVEDQYIVVNENQSGTPGLDGGLVAERGGLEDAYIEWEEGLDVWGTRLENGTLKPITLRDTSMADTGIPYWNEQEERIETASDLTYKEAQSNGFYDGNEVQTSAGVGHPDYTAELEHWYITPGGLGDFRTLLADELRVEAFIAEVEEALAGSDFLTKSFATLDEAFNVPSSSPVGTQKDLTVQDLDGLGATPVFGNNTSEEDDTLRLRITDRSGGGLTVADIWLRCIAGSYTDNGDGTQTWTVEILQAGDAGIGAGLTAPEGSVVLDYGVPGDFLIERSVLNPDSGDIAPYDRMLSWKDNDGDRIPDDYEVLNLRGRLDGLSKAYASGFGTYTETARFTSDIIVGDIEAGASGDQTGSYLRFSDSDGLEVVYGDGFGGTSDGRLSSAVLQLEDDVRLLAKKQLQEGQARAGLETRVGEQAATLRLTAKYQENESELRLRADDATSRIELDAAKTLIDSSLTLTQTDFDTGSVTIRVNAGGDTSQFPTTRPDGSGSLPKKGDGGPLRVGDMLIDTGDGDKPYTWTGSTWTDSYTNISGDDITTGTVDAARIDVKNIQISNLAGAGDYQTKSEANVVVRGNYDGKSNFPYNRPDGLSWIDGDIVIDTAQGSKPFSYDASQGEFIQAYTAIDGGNINTDTIKLNRLSFTNTDGKIKAEDLAITASDLTINATDVEFSPVESSEVIFAINNSSETATINTGRLDVTVDDFTINATDVEFSPVESNEVIFAINNSSETATINTGRLDITVDDLDIDATDVTISGSSKSDVKNAVLQLEDDVRLLAENLTQEQEARAGLELTASETEARFEADVKFAGNTANLTLESNKEESTVSLSGDSVEINGNTTFFGTNYTNPNGIPDGALEDDYTQSGTENVTLRGSGAPDSNTTRSDGSIEVGDIYLNTSNGNRPWSWDGSNWVRQYTSINGGNLKTGTVTANEINVPDIFAQDVTVGATLTLEPDASLQAGEAGSRFAMGDFTLDRKEKGTQTDAIGASANVTTSGIGIDSDGASTQRPVSITSSENWQADVSVPFYVELSSGTRGVEGGVEGKATAKLTIRSLDSNGNILAETETKYDLTFNTGSTGLDSDLSARVDMVVNGTAASDLEIILDVLAEANDSETRAEASIGDDPDGEVGTGPTSNVISSKDFFGPNGGAWRTSGSLQILLNGRQSSGPKSTSPGDAWFAGNVSFASKTNRSDRRLKSEFEDLTDPFDVLSDINGYSYTRDRSGRREIGFVAQEIRDAGAETLVRDEGGVLGVNYDGLQAFEIEALKDLDDRTQDHESRISALEDKIQ